ncbi:MAG: ATP synthase F1 subunit delta [Candidatus Omnitrophica bacterium]|nr:ATP synthase F1 subunit delta [Candidatus Omnitrophota bacterium]
MNQEILIRRYSEAFVGHVQKTIQSDRPECRIQSVLPEPSRTERSEVTAECRIQSVLPEAIGELLAIKKIMEMCPDFGLLLKNPEIPSAEKCALVDAAFQTSVSEDVRNFLKLLIEHKRALFLVAIIDYIREHYLRAAYMNVLVKTASMLDDDLLAGLTKQLERKLQRSVRLFIELDGNLLGGLQIFAGNKIIDASVRKRLSQVKDILKTAELIPWK